MSNFNSDFKDLLDTFTPDINKKMRDKGWVSFLNGYYENRNDTYMLGYKLNGKSFPVVLTFKFHFPWSFHEWNGRSMNAETYRTTDSNTVGGGVLQFDKEFNFELKIDTDHFKAYSRTFDFEAEPDEFENIESEKFTLDLSHKEKNIRQFTKAELSQIVKWLDKAVDLMQQKIEKSIEAQVARRIEEIMKVNEELALKYAPDSIKDMFIF